MDGMRGAGMEKGPDNPVAPALRSPMVNPLEETHELGRRIAAARIYAGWSVGELAKRMHVAADEVRRWEAGLGQGEFIDQRRGLAERIAATTGAPPGLLGLRDDDALTRRVDELEADLALIRVRLGI